MKDWRGGRAAAGNIIPSSTGAAKAVPGGSNTGQTGSDGQGSESGGSTTGKDDTGDGLE